MYRIDDGPISGLNYQSSISIIVAIIAHINILVNK